MPHLVETHCLWLPEIFRKLCINNLTMQSNNHPPPQHNHFTTLFPGPPGWAGARRELLDFMVQGKINRGRHTDHPTGRHSIRTNQYLPPPSPQSNIHVLSKYKKTFL